MIKYCCLSWANGAHLVYFPLPTSRCCCHSACTCAINSRQGGEGTGGEGLWRNGQWRQSDPPFTPCSCCPYSPFVSSPGPTARGRDATPRGILSFQLRPLSLLLSTAAASTANLHSIILQDGTGIEKGDAATGLRVWARGPAEPPNIPASQM